ncbi:MAG: sigma-54-dependent transcriptional regulator, partial [Mariprofundaceae bacterium]
MKESFHILLVEDEKPLRDALQHALSQAQYHVIAVSSALQARETMKENKFDIAIMDIRLPDGNGIDLLREFRHQDQDLCVIITTGYAEVDVAIDAIRLGASDFIRKPFDIDELLIRIEEALKSRNLSRTNRELNRQVQTMHSEETFIGQSESVVRIRKTIELLS